MTMRIDKDGRIAELSSTRSASSDVIGGEGCWIIPGFVDAHLHLPQWDQRGIDGLNLRDWHDRFIYPAEARFRDADFAEKVTEEFVTGMIANGTTTAVSFGSPFAAATDRAFQVFARRGFRAVHGMVLNDQEVPDEIRQDADKAIDEARQLAARWHGGENGRLSYAFSPRSPISCSEKLMRAAAALSQMLRCYLQTNVAESLADETAIRDAFPDSVDDLEIYGEMGMLTSRTLLGHGVFLTRQQRDQVARAGTTLVHCPTANLFMESGMMDYVAHRSAGVRVALGSSIAAGPDPFMPRVAIEAIQTARRSRCTRFRGGPIPCRRRPRHGGR
jgi:guanine deaminase